MYDLFAADGVLESMMLESRPSAARRSSNASASWRKDISKIELRIRHIGVADGVVFIERVDDFVYRGHHGAVPVVGVLEVEQGRVTWREYYDRAQMIEAMGLKQDFDAARRRELSEHVYAATAPRRAAVSPATGGKVTSCGSIVLWQ